MDTNSLQNPALPLARAFLALVEMHEVFQGDLTICIQGLHSEGTQFQWRNFTRALFASVDGTCFGLRRVSLELHDANLLALERGELVLLTEESYELKQNGQLKTRSGNFVPLDRNIRFVFALLSRFCGEEVVDYGQHGWEAFQTSIALRHRLTHPKSAPELVVSKEDSEKLMMATTWWLKHSAYLIEALHKRLLGSSHSVKDAVDQRIQGRIAAGDRQDRSG